MIFNQMTEIHRVNDLAKLVSELTGGEVVYVSDPRKEAAENDLHVRNDLFLSKSTGVDYPKLGEFTP